MHPTPRSSTYGAPRTILSAGDDGKRAHLGDRPGTPTASGQGAASLPAPVGRTGDRWPSTRSAARRAAGETGEASHPAGPEHKDQGRYLSRRCTVAGMERTPVCLWPSRVGHRTGESVEFARDSLPASLVGSSMIDGCGGPRSCGALSTRAEQSRAYSTVSRRSSSNNSRSTPPAPTGPTSCGPSPTSSADWPWPHPRLVALLVTRPLATPLGRRPPRTLRSAGVVAPHRHWSAASA